MPKTYYTWRWFVNYQGINLKQATETNSPCFKGNRKKGFGLYSAISNLKALLIHMSELCSFKFLQKKLDFFVAYNFSLVKFKQSQLPLNDFVLLQSTFPEFEYILRFAQASSNALAKRYRKRFLHLQIPKSKF